MPPDVTLPAVCPSALSLPFLTNGDTAHISGLPDPVLSLRSNPLHTVKCGLLSSLVEFSYRPVCGELFLVHLLGTCLGADAGVSVTLHISEVIFWPRSCLVTGQDFFLQV